MATASKSLLEARIKSLSGENAALQRRLSAKSEQVDVLLVQLGAIIQAVDQLGYEVAISYVESPPEPPS